MTPRWAYEPRSDVDAEIDPKRCRYAVIGGGRSLYRQCQFRHSVTYSGIELCKTHQNHLIRMDKYGDLVRRSRLT